MRAYPPHFRFRYIFCGGTMPQIESYICHMESAQRVQKNGQIITDSSELELTLTAKNGVLTLTNKAGNTARKPLRSIFMRSRSAPQKDLPVAPKNLRLSSTSAANTHLISKRSKIYLLLLKFQL